MYLPINAKYGARTKIWSLIADEIGTMPQFEGKKPLSYRSVRVRFYNLYKMFSERYEIARAGKDTIVFTGLSNIDKLLVKIYHKDTKNNAESEVHFIEEEEKPVTIPDTTATDASSNDTLIDASNIFTDITTYKSDLVKYRKAKMSLLKQEITIKSELLNCLKQEMKNNQDFRSQLLKLLAKKR